MRVWHCTCAGTAGFQGWWRPWCSSTQGRWRSQCSSTPQGYLWGSKTVHGGNRIYKDSMAKHFRWEVLDGWRSLATSHWSLGSTAGIRRCSCRYTISVSIAQWSIFQNWSGCPRTWKCLLCLLLLDWTCDDTNPQKYTLLKLKISTSQGCLAERARRTIVWRYWLDLGSETELRIQVKELLFDDAYLSKVIDDKKSWFTWMELLDVIYHQFFFSANNLGRQPTTSQFFQPLTPPMLALVAAAIHCLLLEYATGKKVTVMFSQDEYRGKFCPSMLMDCLAAEATPLINYTWWAASYPRHMDLLRYNRRSSIPISAPQSGLKLQYFIQRSILHFCWRSSCRRGASQSPPRPRSGVPLFHSRQFTSLPFGDAQHRWAPPLDRRSFAWICTPNFIPHSSITFISPLAHPALHIRHSSYPGGPHLFPANSSYCLSNSIMNHCELTSQFQPFRYPKPSQMILEFYFAQSPGPNCSEIQSAPGVSLRCWWIVSSCFCRPWSDGRWSGWHWDYVRLISFDCSAVILFLVYLLSFLNHSSFSLVLLNVAMQPVECWMRCWVL